MNDFLNGILTRLSAELNPEALGQGVATFSANLVVGALVFTAFYLFWRGLDLVVKRLIRTSRLDETTGTFIESVTQYIVLGIGGIQALSTVGIDAAAVLASLGIVGLTIGFAARDALSNLISGLLIFWDRPFVIDDLVEVEGSYGQVDTITLRSTRVVTSDGRMLAIPNTTIINSIVASYTNFPTLRVDVAVTVAVTEDIDRARRVLLDLVEKDADYLDDPAPRVVITQLNDYNVELELHAWLRDERKHVTKRFDLREDIFDAFNAAGVEMPFETTQIAPLHDTAFRVSTTPGAGNAAA